MDDNPKDAEREELEADFDDLVKDAQGHLPATKPYYNPQVGIGKALLAIAVAIRMLSLPPRE